METAILELNRFKECKGSWRYQAMTKFGFVNHYLSKKILNGAPAPDKLYLTLSDTRP